MRLGTKKEENLDKWVKSKPKDLRNDLSDYSVIICICNLGLELLNVASVILI